MKKLSIFITLLSISSLGAMAQNNFSPYSQLGLGDLEDGFYNRTTGLANTGIAYRSNRFLINNNPASFSALTDQYFTVETGIRGSVINYYGTPIAPSSTQSGDITFRKLIMGIKLAKHWGSSIGLVPFSTQNYEFNVPYFLQGSSAEIANHYYQGHGSINKAYWANSYEFFHHLSIGIDAGYLFGQLNQKDILQNPGTGASLTSTTNNIDLNNLYVGYGLQLYGKLGKKWEYSLGATFSNKTDLFASTNRIVLASDSSTLQNQQLSQTYLTLPTSFGVGLALSRKQKYTFLADYKHQAWTDVQNKNQNTYPGKDYTLGNSDKGSIGFEISKKKTFYNSKVELSYFQTGLYYGTTYLQINGQQIKDEGVTVGFGVNSLKSPLAYSIIFQYGIKGTQSNNLIQERYANITFLVNYGSLWFTKGKKYD
jgi:hypothetical protein